MSNICVRVDAKSTYSGMSNVFRTVSLARELSKLYYDVYFITKFDSSYDKIKSEGFNVFKITDTHALYEGTKRKDQDLIGENPQEVKELFQKHNIDTLILDMPFATEQYIRTYRNLVKRLILVEDYPRFATTANIIINGGLHSDEIDYPEIPNQVIIKGPEYCLIDHQIAELPPRKPKKIAKDIFIFIGAHDRTNLIPTMLATLLSDDIINLFRFHVIVDSLYLSLDKINQISLAHPNVNIYNMPDNVLDIMLECDIAICNDFYSIHRLLGCGVPTISILVSEPDSVYTDKMEELIESIWEHKYIGLVNEDTNIEKVILKKVTKLIESYNMRSALFEKGKKAVDGLGAQRIANILKNIIKK